MSMEYYFDEITGVDAFTPPNYLSSENPPNYINNASGFDVKRENDNWGYYKPDSIIFKNKYNNISIETDEGNNDSYKLDEMLNIDNQENIDNEINSGGKFSFNCYPSETAIGPVHVVSKRDVRPRARYIHTAEAVFKATAYVSANEIPESFVEGSYRMHVTITAVESAP